MSYKQINKTIKLLLLLSIAIFLFCSLCDEDLLEKDDVTLLHLRQIRTNQKMFGLRSADG